MDEATRRRSAALPWTESDLLVAEERRASWSAFSATEPQRREDGGVEPRAEIWTIGVRPDRQGAGLGRQLLRWGVAHLRELGVETVTLSVNGRNPRALGLYESEGFVRTSTRERWARPVPTRGVNPLAPFEARPRAAAILGALAIAFSGIFYRLSAVSPSTAVFFRALYGLPLLVVVARSEDRRLGPMTRRAVGLSAVAGLFFAVDLMAFHYAVDAIGAGLATVLANLQVVIVAIVAWLAFGERVRREVVVAIPVMLLGVVLISGVVGTGAYGADPRAGVSLGLHHRGVVRRVPARDPAREPGPAPGGARGDLDRRHRAVRARVRPRHRRHRPRAVPARPRLPARARASCRSRSGTSRSRRRCRGCPR